MHDIRGLTGVEAFDYIRQVGGAWVVYRPVGGIGDAVMLLPTINGLRREIGDDLLVVSCVDYIAPVFKANPNVDYTFTYNGDEIGKGMDRKDLGVLQDFGSVIFKYYYPCPAAVYESLFTPYRIDEFGYTWPTNRSIKKSRQEIFCDHAEVECLTDDYQFGETDIDNWSLEELGLPDRYIAVQLRSHDIWRDYPRMKWLLYELVKLGKKQDFRVVAFDSTKQVDIKGVISFAQLGLEKVFSLIRSSVMLVGPDSMGVHVKGAMNGKVLGLFGPTSPSVRLKYKHAVWMPRFMKCRRQYCWYTPCKYRFCLSSGYMKPKHILRKVQYMLEEAE